MNRSRPNHHCHIICEIFQLSITWTCIRKEYSGRSDVAGFDYFWTDFLCTFQRFWKWKWKWWWNWCWECGTTTTRFWYVAAAERGNDVIALSLVKVARSSTKACKILGWRKQWKIWRRSPRNWRRHLRKCKMQAWPCWTIRTLWAKTRVRADDIEKIASPFRSARKRGKRVKIGKAMFPFGNVWKSPWRRGAKNQW